MKTRQQPFIKTSTFVLMFLQTSFTLWRKNAVLPMQKSLLNAQLDSFQVLYSRELRKFSFHLINGKLTFIPLFMPHRAAFQFGPVLQFSNILLCWRSPEWHNSKLREWWKAPNPQISKCDKSTTVSDKWNFAYLFCAMQAALRLFTA